MLYITKSHRRIHRFPVNILTQDHFRRNTTMPYWREKVSVPRILGFVRTPESAVWIIIIGTKFKGYVGSGPIDPPLMSTTVRTDQRSLLQTSLRPMGASANLTITPVDGSTTLV
ncbi:hypothetical protein TNCV_814691 [Trichonephila clavipes]|nr:hypothetical protein TNCV_814691 [Trichonephila clavipes]